MPVNTNPVDYSPEACPPEFARSFLSDGGSSFLLRPSYDVWSLGLAFYNLSTGRGYFDGRNPKAITKFLGGGGGGGGGGIYVGGIEEKRLRALVKSCLQTDPKKRPNINSILLHPFFTTTGIGTWSF